MKRLVFLFAILPCLFCGCKKEVPTSKVTYSVIENSSSTPTYSIEYTNEAGGGQISTSSAANSFSSGSIELKQGQTIVMKVSCADPNYLLNCSIFINGHLWKSESFSSGGSLTLSGEIPAE